MRKLLIAFTLAVGLIVVPQNSEAAHHYLYTYDNGTKVYLDDQTIDTSIEMQCKAVVIFNYADGSSASSRIIVRKNHRGYVWQDVHNSQNGWMEISYSNVSGYAKDWMVNRGLFD